MKRMQWELRRAVAATGLPGWAGVVLLLGCVLMWWLAIEPMRSETESLRVAAADAQQRLVSKSSAATLPTASPQQQLDAFRHRFGDAQTISSSLGRLQAIARQQGLHLAQAEFRFTSNAGEPVMRYTIELPIKAGYRALRRFTRAAMLELPGLAIEEVSLRRGGPKSPTLEARLRFVLFLSRAD